MQNPLSRWAWDKAPRDAHDDLGGKWPQGRGFWGRLELRTCRTAAGRVVMITDALHGVRCPSCGISALHPEAPAERISVDEIIVLDSAGGYFRVVRTWIQCVICGTPWPVAMWADALDAQRLAAWLRHHPVQQLPHDCPR